MRIHITATHLTEVRACHRRFWSIVAARDPFGPSRNATNRARVIHGVQERYAATARVILPANLHFCGLARELAEKLRVGNLDKLVFKAPRKLCKAAGIGPAAKPDGSTRVRTPKDLRDTFASQLLTAGVQLGYVSRQLGHSDVSITARHYARWAGGDAYRSPLEVREYEVPADLMSRLSEKSPQNPPQSAEA